MKVADPSKFQEAKIINCPHCGCQNLSWRIVCTWCQKDLEAPVEAAQKTDEFAA